MAVLKKYFGKRSLSVSNDVIKTVVCNAIATDVKLMNFVLYRTMKAEDVGYEETASRDVKNNVILEILLLLLSKCLR